MMGQSWPRGRLKLWALVLAVAALENGRRGAAGEESPPTPAKSSQSAPESARPHIGHVLIISEDGLRGDAVAKLHLHWHELLKRGGADSYSAMTIRHASTLPAHASMLSGVEAKVHGLTWNNWRPERGYIKAPTIFTEATEHGLSAAFFTGKPKLRHIVPPGSVAIY